LISQKFASWEVREKRKGKIGRPGLVLTEREKRKQVNRGGKETCSHCSQDIFRVDIGKYNWDAMQTVSTKPC